MHTFHFKAIYYLLAEIYFLVTLALFVSLYACRRAKENSCGIIIHTAKKLLLGMSS